MTKKANTKQFAIMGYETDEGCPSTCCVVGIKSSLSSAQKAMKKMMKESLKEFSDEYVDTETDMTVVIKSHDVADYVYTMFIVDPKAVVL